MIGRLFGLITGLLGLVGSVITIGDFFFTAPHPPQSSSYAIEDAVIGFVLFYGWIALSAVLIQRAIQKEPWRSKVKQGWTLFGGSKKFQLTFQSTMAVGLLIWPILIAFIAMIDLQAKTATGVIVYDCAFIPLLVLFLVGTLLAMMQMAFMSMFIED